MAITDHNSVHDPDLAAVVDQISVQLDGTTAVIRLPARVVHRLNANGQSIAKDHASSMLGHPVEFYIDSHNHSRIYLASLASINECRPSIARPIKGSNILLLLPAPPQPARQPATASNGVQQFNNLTPTHEAPEPSTPAPKPKRRKTTAKDTQKGQAPKKDPKAPKKDPKAPKKDPTVPKKEPKTPNAFLLYRTDCSRQLDITSPGMKNGEKSRVIGDWWGGLSVEEKECRFAQSRALRDERAARISAAQFNSEQVVQQQQQQQQQGHQTMFQPSPLSSHSHNLPNPGQNQDSSRTAAGEYLQQYYSNPPSLDHSAQAAAYATPESQNTDVRSPQAPHDPVDRPHDSVGHPHAPVGPPHDHPHDHVDPLYDPVLQLLYAEPNNPTEGENTEPQPAGPSVDAAASSTQGPVQLPDEGSIDPTPHAYEPQSMFDEAMRREQLGADFNDFDVDLSPPPPLPES
ncbi:hypothetical protein SAMD00023353_6200430 [Rosellinia necatrix]|uniref:HMG box domain-containing protein n=1 Tax=Rosellinia necatrix TaxID=77044 RepID=A0A1W2TSF4_ROSNE|nr:hypothetical protein SAMD00023353_6200430 [Rosellinia necatrix]